MHKLRGFMRLSKEALSNDASKWIQLSKLTYDMNGAAHQWEMVERKHKKSTVDAIIIAPILINNGPPKTILTLQYRPPIDKISVEFPAGLTDPGEFPEQTALRELLEETGYSGKVISTSPVLSSDCGLTSATFQIVKVQVDLQHEANKNPTQNLQDNEAIELKIVEINGLLDTLNDLSKSCCIDGKLYHFAMGLHAFKPPQLSNDQINAYHKDGYLVIPNVLSDQECDALVQHSLELCHQFDPKQHHAIFATTDDAKHTKDLYFLDSYDKIRYFVEEDASPDALSNNINCINKIGHALHIDDAHFKRISDSAIISNIAYQLGMKAPTIMQSMVIYKQPKIGGKVNLHQDASFLINNKQLIGFWIALQDTTIENGCLQVAKSSHVCPVNTCFERQPDNSTNFNNISAVPSGLTFENIIVKKGTLVLLHGNLYHQSMVNTSSNTRIAYTCHIADIPNPQTDWSCYKNWIKYSRASYKI